MKDFILGLGIFLGIIQPSMDPTLAGRLYRDSQAIYSNFEITNALSADAGKLLEAGNALVLTLFFGPNEEFKGVKYIHTIVFDPLRKIYMVILGETGRSHITNDLQTALIIFSRYSAVKIAAAETFVQLTKGSLSVKASLGVSGDPQFDSGILWGYKVPETRFTFASLTDIPF